MKNREIAERRAVNQIWNAAQDYSLQPVYVAFDEDGDADFYFNTVIGAVYHYFQFETLDKMFTYLQRRQNGELYVELLWLGLENCVFGKAKDERPAMAELRRAYAEKFLARPKDHVGESLLWDLKRAHCQRILGQADDLDEEKRKILDALEFPADCNTEQVTDRMDRLLNQYFFKGHFKEFEELGGHISDSPFFLPKGWGKRAGSALRRIDWEGKTTEEKDSLMGKARKLYQRLTFSRPSAKVVRAYVESCFGKSMFSTAEMAEIEKKLCTEAHRECLLHFTRGEFTQTGELTREAAEQREFAEKQREANEAYFQANESQTMLAVNKLTERIRNAILLQLEPTVYRTRAGNLLAGKVWRNVYLHDERIFEKTSDSQLDTLTVDILLDGSASQREQQAKVATQGFIIAESLTRCNIPVRVSAFSSVSGCTVMQVLRDYHDTSRNKDILHFLAAGWNRDGLALRAADYLMEQERSEHKMLIILSDAHPNDDHPMPSKEGLHLPKDYGGEAGVQDVAEEVSRLRRKGIWVISVFTGNDRDLPAAHKIYGRELARIRSVSWFADTVGRLIQERIREM